MSLSRLVNVIATDTQLPASSLMLLVGGRSVDSDLVMLPRYESTLFLEMRLCGAVRGGKGGFGANLRGANASKKTTDFGACRDLSGRRLRDVERERAASERAAAAPRVPDTPTLPAEPAETIAPEVVEEGVDVDALEEDIEECKNSVEDAVAEGLRAARVLRKQQAKVAKSGRKRNRRNALQTPVDEADGKRLKKSGAPNVVLM